MAICNPTGSLTVTISENIQLPNGNIESATKYSSYSKCKPSSKKN